MQETESLTSELIQDGADLRLGLTIIASPDRHLESVTTIPGDALCVGRKGSVVAELAIDDRKLSRDHFSLRALDARRIELLDAGSKNGTYVNGFPVCACVLSPGDLIRAGNSLFIFDWVVGSRHNVSSDEVYLGRSSSVVRLRSRARELRGERSVLIIGEPGSGRRQLARYHLGQVGASERAAMLDAESGWDPPEETDVVVLVEPPLEVVRALRRRSKQRLICVITPEQARAFQKLGAILWRVPPLQERRDDIPELARHMWVELGRSLDDLSTSLLEALALMPWPEQLPELRQVLRDSRLQLPDDYVDALRLLRIGRASPAMLVEGAPPLSEEMSLAERFAHHTPSEDALIFDPDEGLLRIPGEGFLELAHRPVQRRLLAALMERRVATPGSPCTSYDLIDIVWPDEDILPDAAANRLYKSLSMLRKLGLRPYLLKDDEGYFLDPEVPVAVPRQ